MISSIGKGMFANVVRARVLQNETGEAGKEVAIKIIRSQESMFVFFPSPLKRTYDQLGTRLDRRKFKS